MSRRIDRQHARTEDPVGVALAKLENLAGLLGVDYVESGGVSASYLHQLDGALALVKELAEIQSVQAHLIETAEMLGGLMEHSPMLPLDTRITRMRGGRLGIARDLQDVLRNTSNA